MAWLADPFAPRDSQSQGAPFGRAGCFEANAARCVNRISRSEATDAAIVGQWRVLAVQAVTTRVFGDGQAGGRISTSGAAGLSRAKLRRRFDARTSRP